MTDKWIGIAKYEPSIDLHQTRTFTADSEDGPLVSFAQPDGEMLILLKGQNILNSIDGRFVARYYPTSLRYTIKEWNAFLSGVRDGEFDEMVTATPRSAIPIRDSKDPTGPILVFTVWQIIKFLEAIKSGKYNLVKI